MVVWLYKWHLASLIVDLLAKTGPQCIGTNCVRLVKVSVLWSWGWPNVALGQLSTGPFFPQPVANLLVLPRKYSHVLYGMVPVVYTEHTHSHTHHTGRERGEAIFEYNICVVM